MIKVSYVICQYITYIRFTWQKTRSLFATIPEWCYSAKFSANFARHLRDRVQPSYYMHCHNTMPAWQIYFSCETSLVWHVEVYGGESCRRELIRCHEIRVWVCIYLAYVVTLVSETVVNEWSFYMYSENFYTTILLSSAGKSLLRPVLFSPVSTQLSLSYFLYRTCLHTSRSFRLTRLSSCPLLCVYPWTPRYSAIALKQKFTTTFAI